MTHNLTRVCAVVASKCGVLPSQVTTARIISIATVARAMALLLVMILTLSALWLSPWIWLWESQHLTKYPILILLISLNLFIFWIPANVVAIREIKYVRSKQNILLDQHSSVEIPADRQRWASELIEFIESKLSKDLRARLQVCLGFAPRMECRRAPRSSGHKWRITIGFSTIAVLSADEIKALALQRAVSRICPVTQAHVWLTDLYNRAAWWKFALPPHPGYFSFPRCFIEWLVKILEPIPGQLESSGLNVASRDLPVDMLRNSAEKEKVAGILLERYIEAYHSKTERGVMPPYTEGFFRFCRTAGLALPTPVFTEIEGLWVYERQFLERCFGSDYVRNLRIVSWDDLQAQVDVPAWRAMAAQIRPVLSGFRVADIPQLVTDWRSVQKKWLRSIQKVPVVTPDLQHRFLMALLAVVFAVVLLDAGWQPDSTSSETVSLVSGTASLYPLRLVGDLVAKKISSVQFTEICRNLGVADLPLGTSEDRMIGD